MTEYLSNKQVNSLLRKLNACYSNFGQWSARKAQKGHTDIFEQEISNGDYYYRSKIDGNLGNDLKLSEGSMERILYIIFINKPVWEEHADNIITEKQNDIRNIIEKLRP